VHPASSENTNAWPARPHVATLEVVKVTARAGPLVADGSLWHLIHRLPDPVAMATAAPVS